MISFSSLHALRAPEPFLRVPYDNFSCCSAPPLGDLSPQLPQHNNHKFMSDGLAEEDDIVSDVRKEQIKIPDVSQEEEKIMSAVLHGPLLGKEEAEQDRPSPDGGDDTSTLYDTPFLPANRLLHDVSLLMGESRADNNDAFFHYVTDNLLLPLLQPSLHNTSLEDFKGDGFSREKCIDSFGTRAQLGKLLMEYDEKHGKLSN